MYSLQIDSLFYKDDIKYIIKLFVVGSEFELLHRAQLLNLIDILPQYFVDKPGVYSDKYRHLYMLYLHIYCLPIAACLFPHLTLFIWGCGASCSH